MTLLKLITVLLTAFQIIEIEDIERSEPVSFESEVLPILQRNCLACHSASERRGELVLETPQTILKGGDSGPAVVPGKGDDSLLIEVASHLVEPVMPPEDNDVAATDLTPQELGLIRLWINQGATGSGTVVTMSPRNWAPLPAGIHPVQAVELTDDGQYLVCGRANQIFLYHVPSGQLTTRLTDPALQVAAGGQTGIAHRDLVQSLALNSDGDLLASGSFREVKIWRRPRDVQRFTINSGNAAAIAVTPDRQTLAVPFADNTVRLFSTSDGAPRKVLSGHKDIVTALRFTSDGTSLVSGSRDRSIRIWNIADGTQQAEIETPTAVTAVEIIDPVAASAEMPHPEHLIASGGEEPLIRTWAIPQTTAPDSPLPVDELMLTCHSRDGRMQAFGRADGEIVVMSTSAQADVQTLTETARWKVDPPALAMSIGRHGETDVLLTGAADGSLRMWTLPNPALKATWNLLSEPAEQPADGATADSPADTPVAPAAPITAVAISADGNTAVCGMQTGAVLLWDLQPVFDGTPQAALPVLVRPFEGNTQPITRLLFHANGQTVFCAAQDGSLRGYNTQSGQQTFSTNHGAEVDDLALSPNGQILATAGRNAQVRLWQTNGSEFGARTITGFSGGVQRVCFSPDQSVVLAAVGGERPEVHVIDVQTGALLQRFTRHTGDCISLVALEENRILTATDRGVWQWQVVAGRTLAGHSQPITSLAKASDNPMQLYSGSKDATVRLWNLSNGQQIRQFNHGAAVNAVAVSPDGQRIASAGDNNMTKLWRSNGQSISDLRGDVRLKTLLARAQQQQTAANARLALAKRQLDAAEKDVPVQTEKEKKASEALTASQKVVNDKSEELKLKTEEKRTAEAAAVSASVEVNKALQVKQLAEQAAMSAGTEMAAMQARLNRLQQVLNANVQDENLKQLVAETQAAVTACQQREQQMKAAVEEPRKKFDEMAVIANDAAKKVNDIQKPFSDAVEAVRKAEADAKLLMQQQLLIAEELRQSRNLVPERTEIVKQAEADVESAKTSVENATQVSREAEQPVHSVRFSDDGRVLVTAGAFSGIHTWDAETGTAMAAYAGHTAAINALEFSTGGQFLSAAADGTLRAWELNPEWVLERTIGSVDDPAVIVHRVTALDFSRESDRLLVAGGVPSRSGEVQIFDVADGRQVMYAPESHSDVIYAVAFSPDGKRIATAGADKYVRTLSVATGEQLRRLEGHTNYVLGVAWKADGQTIASSAADDSIKIWDAETGDQRRTIANFDRHVTSIRFIGETDNIVSVSGDKRVRIQNSSNGGNVRNFSPVEHWLHSVDITPDGSLIAAGDAAGNVYIWNGTNSQLLKTFGLPETP